jgi:hypothetical protein
VLADHVAHVRGKADNRMDRNEVVRKATDLNESVLGIAESAGLIEQPRGLENLTDLRGCVHCFRRLSQRRRRRTKNLQQPNPPFKAMTVAECLERHRGELRLAHRIKSLDCKALRKPVEERLLRIENKGSVFGTRAWLATRSVLPHAGFMRE